jgi:Rod binding domain-containing protein
MNVTESVPLLETAGSLLEGKQPTKLANAAQQFEALMIGEMMKSAREGSSGGWLSSDADSSEETAMGMAEAQFAQALASRGGFGLAKMIEKSMARQTDAQNENAVPDNVSGTSLK